MIPQMKSQTFGFSSRVHRKTVMKPFIEQAIQDYKNNRLNGSKQDFPARPFPNDGRSEFLSPPGKPSSPEFGWGRIKYTAGKQDEAWMKECDTNYLARKKNEKKQVPPPPPVRKELDMITRLEREASHALDEVNAARTRYDKTLSEIAKKNEAIHKPKTPGITKVRNQRELVLLEDRARREQQLLIQKENRANQSQQQLTNYLTANPGVGAPTASTQSLAQTNTLLMQQMAAMQRQMLIMQQQIAASMPSTSSSMNNDDTTLDHEATAVRPFSNH